MGAQAGGNYYQWDCRRTWRGTYWFVAAAGKEERKDADADPEEGSKACGGTAMDPGDPEHTKSWDLVVDELARLSQLRVWEWEG